MTFVKVWINKKIPVLNHDFTYSIPAELENEVKIGSVLAVPFGNGNTKAIAIAFTEIPPVGYQIKPISGILNDAFTCPEDLLHLADKLSRYYLNTTIGMLRAMIPAGINLFGTMQGAKQELTYCPAENQPENVVLRSKKQAELLEIINAEGALSVKEIKALGFSSSQANGLYQKNLVIKCYRDISRGQKSRIYSPDNELPVLTEEQSSVLTAIEQRPQTDKRPILLHGVTGSGKTEIYLRLIQKQIEQGKQTIVLLPEIALTPHFIAIFENRFHNLISVFHSRLSAGERRDHWQSFRNGESMIALGARSCIFAPARNLGLIIIDEEHEETYEQDTAPRFHARTAALFRQKYSDADLVLGSATPSFESYQKAKNGDYLLLEMKNRVGNIPLPQINTVDMREELKCGWTEVLSRELIQAIHQTLNRGKQVMLFLNRLGYHTFVSCRDCGFVHRCPECGVSLTYYREQNKLACTRCNYQREITASCPQCGSKKIRYFGLGTEQLEAVVRHHFPNAVIDRLDSERIRHKGDLEKIYENMRSGNTDILIGTKMIAKGWDFSDVALMGIIAADYTLNFPDFRSGEKTFQLIAQVAGRCGRSDEQGKVYLQTYRPDEPALLFGGQQDFEAYYQWESISRRKFGYPPFCHLLKIVFTVPVNYFSGEDLPQLRKILEKTDETRSLRIFGPSPAVYREKDKDKWVVTLLGDNLFSLQATANAGIIQLQKEKIIDRNIKVQIETEPMHSV